jgi:hypothetical protein
MRHHRARFTRYLIDQAQSIPPDTTVPVLCRLYAPAISSVTPDGYWCLIDHGEWAGRSAPANSFTNGDVRGRPTLHDTDPRMSAFINTATSDNPGYPRCRQHRRYPGHRAPRRREGSPASEGQSARQRR